MTASAEETAVAAGSSSVPVPDDVFDGGVVDLPSSSEDESDNEGAVHGEDEEDDLSAEADYFSSDEEGDDTGDDDVVDSDSEFEEDDDEVPKVVKNGVGEVAAAPCTFLGQPARIATVQSTVCFVNLATSSAPPCQCQCHHGGGGGGGGEIIVDYRYTRFLRTQSGGDGVDMHILGPKQARLRFVLPSPLASDSDPETATTVSSSLRFAGAMLASLVHPACFSAQLQALWSVTTVPVLVPARTTCLLVTVDVGILRPGDFTAARMRRMCEALESVAGERAALPATSFEFDIAIELHLPVLLRSEEDVRPTKRRKVTGEDCPICCDVLEEQGRLAAWPRCSHIFHAGCLEQHLLRGYQECPLCRSELKLSPTPHHVENEY